MDAAPEPTPGQRAPLLAVAGGLLLLAALLQANPWFGASTSAWPWEVFARGRSPISLANWGLWLLTGLAAVAWGLRHAGRLRATLLAAPALVLVFTCSSRQAGLRIEENSLFVLLGVTLLLTAFLQQARGERAGPVRLLAGLGAVLVLWTLTCSFEYAAGQIPRSKLASDVGDLVAYVQGKPVPTARPFLGPNLIAVGALLLSAALGLCAALGLRQRAVGWCGLVATVAVFCVRPLSNYVELLRQSGFDGVTLARQMGEILVPLGLGLAFLGAALLDDLVRQDPRPLEPGAAT
jgi:hypothetical protein